VSLELIVVNVEQTYLIAVRPRLTLSAAAKASAPFSPKLLLLKLQNQHNKDPTMSTGQDMPKGREIKLTRQ
jgi:hypothetical protein